MLLSLCSEIAEHEWVYAKKRKRERLIQLDTLGIASGIIEKPGSIVGEGAENTDTV